MPTIFIEMANTLINTATSVLPYTAKDNFVEADCELLKRVI